MTKQGEHRERQGDSRVVFRHSSVSVRWRSARVSPDENAPSAQVQCNRDEQKEVVQDGSGYSMVIGVLYKGIRAPSAARC